MIKPLNNTIALFLFRKLQILRFWTLMEAHIMNNEFVDVTQVEEIVGET